MSSKNNPILISSDDDEPKKKIIKRVTSSSLTNPKKKKLRKLVPASSSDEEVLPGPVSRKLLPGAEAKGENAKEENDTESDSDSKVEMKISKLSPQLSTDSVEVFTLPSNLALHTVVETVLSDMPEIIDPDNAVSDLSYPISDEHPSQIVLGGFGASGCPSLSHHPLIRAVRQHLYEFMEPVFAKMYPGRRLEVLFDRFGIRREGTKIGAESWHRDVGPKKLGDIIYGGWVNLDWTGTSPQKFSCVPGNVLAPNINHLGFAKIPKSDHPSLTRDLRVLSVAPGQLVLFDQSIAHKISGATSKSTSFRMYIGWRITDDIVPVYDKATVIQEQSMPPLPSGQPSVMYAKLHWVNWQSRLLDFSSRFKPEFLDSKRPGCVMRVLPGLVETGHAFPAYTAEETEMFFPQVLGRIAHNNDSDGSMEFNSYSDD